MSRIRSVHPGLFTDEAFVSMSPMARLLFIGLWNECDDEGVFEWSPLKLKMRLLPADTVDAAALLDEIAGFQRIMRFEVGGRGYGAVRNFCKWQRPKKPSVIHPQTEEVGAWVNIAARITRDGSRGGGEPLRNRVATAPPIARRMEDEGEEDGGGRMETGSDEPVVAPRRRATRLPSDFIVPQDWREFARAERHWSDADIAIEAASFCDYWRARGGREGTKLDWQATWRNWVRSARRPDGIPPPRTLSAEELRAHELQRADLYDRIGREEEAAKLRRRWVADGAAAADAGTPIARVLPALHPPTDGPPRPEKA